MDNHGAPDGAGDNDGDLLRTHGHGTRCRRESREDVPQVEGEGR